MGATNNPGKLISNGTPSTAWQGATSNVAGQFTDFDTSLNGYRAVTIDTRSKVIAAGPDGLSIQDWANQYSPPNAPGNTPLTPIQKTEQMEILMDLPPGYKLNAADMANPDFMARWNTAVAITEGPYRDASGNLVDPRTEPGVVINSQGNIANPSTVSRDGAEEGIQAPLTPAQSPVTPPTTTPPPPSVGTDPTARPSQVDLKCVLPPSLGRNPLHDLTNYTYRLIISALTTETYNKLMGGTASIPPKPIPETRTPGTGGFNTLRGGTGPTTIQSGPIAGQNSPTGEELETTSLQIPGPGSILIASGGADLKDKNQYGVQDMFFDELILKTVAGSGTGSTGPMNPTFALEIDMRIIEPLGTTLFERLAYSGSSLAKNTLGPATIQSLSKDPRVSKKMGSVAQRSQVKPTEEQNKAISLTEQIFLLTIEFKGYKTATSRQGLTMAAGEKNFSSLSSNSNGDYKGKYHIPFIFTKIDTDITFKGTEYRCSAIPIASKMFFTLNQSLSSTITLSEGGKLPAVLEELANKLNASQPQLPPQMKGNKIKIRIAEDVELNNVDAKRVADEWRQAIFRNGAPIDISRTRFVQPINRAQQMGGTRPGQQQGNSPTQAPHPSVYMAGFGTTLIEMINSIMLRTDWVTNEVNKLQQNKTQQELWWWDVKAVLKIDPAQQSNNPRIPGGMIFEYVVEPIKIQVPNWIDNNGPCEIPNLKTFRNYRYIFTGKNDDILKWDLEFDGLMYSALPMVQVLNTSAQPGQPIQGGGITPGAEGKPGGIQQQRKVSFPTLDDVTSKGNKQKEYRPDWFSPTQKGTSDGRTKRYDEMFNASLMESLFQQALSKNQWELDIEIIGDPEYLGVLNKLTASKVPGPDPTTRASSPQNRNRFRDFIKTEESRIPMNEVTTIGLEFLTPTDVNPANLKYNGFKAADFNGIYLVTTIKHIFRNGKFTQELHLIGTNIKCCKPANSTPQQEGIKPAPSQAPQPAEPPPQEEPEEEDPRSVREQVLEQEELAIRPPGDPRIRVE